MIKKKSQGNETCDFDDMSEGSMGGIEYEEIKGKEEVKSGDYATNCNYKSHHTMRPLSNYLPKDGLI